MEYSEKEDFNVDQNHFLKNTIPYTTKAKLIVELLSSPEGDPLLSMIGNLPDLNGYKESQLHIGDENRVSITFPKPIISLSFSHSLTVGLVPEDVPKLKYIDPETLQAFSIRAVSDEDTLEFIDVPEKETEQFINAPEAATVQAQDESVAAKSGISQFTRDFKHPIIRIEITTTVLGPVHIGPIQWSPHPAYDL